MEFKGSNELKTGLKLWSTNENYIDSVRKIKDKFDFIELFVVPNSLDKLNLWRDLQDELGVKFSIHAPHFSVGLDFSNPAKFATNKALVEQTKIYKTALNAFYTLFHPGIGGSLDESVGQMKSLVDFEFVVENKPFIVPMQDDKTAFCVGSTVEQIGQIMSQTGAKFCLDIGHAICSANYQNKEIYSYLREFKALKPLLYHLSDNHKDSVFDAHFHFGDGEFDFGKILEILNHADDENKNPHYETSPHATYIAIETNKDSKENLDDFIKDCDFISAFWSRK